MMPPLRTKFVLLKWVSAIVVAFLVALVFGGLKSPRKKSSQAPDFSKRDWKERQVHELKLTAPFEFLPHQMRLGVSEDFKALTESYDVYESVTEDKSFVVQICRVSFKDGLEPDVDGAVDDAIANAAGTLGDADPTFTSDTIKVLGTTAQARLISYEPKGLGKGHFIEGLLIADSNKLWQVQAIYGHPSCKSDALRIVKSTTFH